MIRFFLLLLLVCPYSYGLSEVNSGSRIIERLERMERDLISLQRQFYKGKVPEYSAFSSTKEGTNIANLDARIASLEEKIRHLIGSIEQIQHELSKQQQLIYKTNEDHEMVLSQDDAKKNITKNTEVEETKNLDKIREKKSEAKMIGKVKITPTDVVDFAQQETMLKDEKEEEETSKSKDLAEELYEQSFLYLRETKIEEAEKGFASFIEKYPDSKLIGNAYYWLGETYLSKKDYKQAGANFLRSYNKEPTGNKAYESLIKLASSFALLDKKKEACSVIHKLENISNRLNGTIKQKIKEESNKIGCN